MKSKKTPNKTPVKDWFKGAVIAVILISVFTSQAGNTYDINKSVIASGGEAKGVQYKLKAAIGQPVTSKSASTTYQMTAGFYQQNRDLIFINEFESN